MERKFKKGDLVRLKSDDMQTPLMTVNGYWIDTVIEDFYNEKCSTLVLCAWRDIEGVPHDENYEEDALEKVVK